jgi:hypothetical protein
MGLSIKVFGAFIMYDIRLMFATVSHFGPSLIFAGRVRTWRSYNSSLDLLKILAKGRSN